MWGGDFPSPENFGIFSLEMAHFGANSVAYIVTEILGNLLLGPRQLLSK